MYTHVCVHIQIWSRLRNAANTTPRSNNNKRDVEMRPTYVKINLHTCKETDKCVQIHLKRDLQHLKRDLHTCKETDKCVQIHLKRDLQHLKRDLHTCKETDKCIQIHLKRDLQHLKRDLHTCKETYTCVMIPTNVKRDLQIWRETDWIRRSKQHTRRSHSHNRHARAIWHRQRRDPTTRSVTSKRDLYMYKETYIRIQRQWIEWIMHPTSRNVKKRPIYI